MSKPQPSRAFHAGLALILIVLAYLPGQSSASTTRWWLLVGMLPLALSFSLPLLSLSHHRSARAWLALIPLALASMLWGAAPGMAMLVALWAWGWTAALLLGLSRPDPNTLKTAAASAGAIAAAIALIPGWEQGGTFGNPDLLAGMLALTWLWTVIPLPGRKRHVLELTSALLQTVVILRSESLGALLAIGLGVAAWMVQHLASTQRRTPAMILTATLLLVLAGLGLGSATVDDHARSRTFMAQQSTAALATAPILGAGAGNFPAKWMDAQAQHFAQPENASERDLWTHAHHAHNEVLHMAVELGLLGALLLLFPIVVALRHAPQGPPKSAVVAGCALALVSLPLYEPATAFLFALSLGMALPRSHPRPSAPRLASLGRGLAVVAAVVACGHFVSDRLLVRGVEMEREATLELAAMLSLEPAPIEQARAELLAAVAPEAALALAQHAAKRDPSPVVWLHVGHIAARAGHPRQAAHAFEEATRLHPWFFSAWFNLAIVHEARGEHVLATRTAERARSLQPWDPRLPLLPR